VARPGSSAKIAASESNAFARRIGPFSATRTLGLLAGRISFVDNHPGAIDCMNFVSAAKRGVIKAGQLA
jgi:hypothetical protein